MADKQDYQVKMDTALLEGVEVLKGMPEESILPMADFFKNFYLKAGYKRLGKLLVLIGKEGVQILEHPNQVLGD